MTLDSTIILDRLGEGTTRTELLVAERPAGAALSIPVAVIKGTRPGPTLLIVAGVHPTEYAGIEAALRLANGVHAEEVSGTIIVVPFVNLIGFNSRIPGGCPEDMVDIFRVFPGTQSSSIGHAIAYQVFEQLVTQSDYVVDLHGGEINESEAIPLAWFPTTGDKEVDEKSKQLAIAFGPDFLLDVRKIWFDGLQEAPLPQGLLIYEAAKRGVPAVIGEAGGAGKAGDRATDRLYGGLLGVCRSVGILAPHAGREGAALQRNSAPTLIDLTLMLSKHDGLLSCRTAAGQKVSEGELLAEITRWDGALLQQILAPFDGIVTITVNWLPVRTGEYVLALARPV